MRPRSPIEPPLSCLLSREPFSISPRRTQQKYRSRSSVYWCGSRHAERLLMSESQDVARTKGAS